MKLANFQPGTMSPPSRDKRLLSALEISLRRWALAMRGQLR